MDSRQRQAVEALPVQPLLQESPPTTGWRGSPTVLAELDQLARGTDSLSDRSEKLYSHLRKHVGAPESIELLQGIVVLARRGEDVGARLLAALLDVHAPGAEMLTRIHQFDSARRLRRLIEGGSAPGARQHWVGSLAAAEQLCRGREAELGPAPPATGSGPREEPPFPLLRRWLEHLLALLARRGDLDDPDQRLLIDLARLEVDAYEERISLLASGINPFLKSAVTRVLPLLCQADNELRSMREFIQSLESDRAGVAFRSRRARVQEVLDATDREALWRSLEGQQGLAELLGLLRGLERNPIPLRRLAGSAARLMALAHLLRRRGLRETELDLVAAAAVVQRFDRDGELLLPLGVDLAATVAELLPPTEPAGALPPLPIEPAAGGPAAGPTGAAVPAIAGAVRPQSAAAADEEDGGFARWPLDGLVLDGDLLVLRLPREGRGDRVWRNGLPTPTAAADADRQADQLDTAAMKRLVMANLDNVSVTIGFLRNPKVVSIPGLVAMVATRCRTARILEMIAHDRNLYGGYANKDVPRALLTSPCNISVKALQKFIHVRFVNRVDLQRMAKDRAGIRREVCREIQDYLATLGGS